jgi:hypothetical protein
LNRRLVADVDGDCNSFAARQFNFAPNAISIGAIDVCDDNGGARRGKMTGKLAPNSLSGPRHDDDPVLDAEIARVRRHSRVLGRVDRRGMGHAESLGHREHRTGTRRKTGVGFSRQTAIEEFD